MSYKLFGITQNPSGLFCDVCGANKFKHIARLDSETFFINTFICKKCGAHACSKEMKENLKDTRSPRVLGIKRLKKLYTNVLTEKFKSNAWIDEDTLDVLELIEDKILKMDDESCCSG